MVTTYWLIPIAIVLGLATTVASAYVTCRVWERLHVTGRANRARAWDLLLTYAVVFVLIAVVMGAMELVL
ncbi:MAG: hypothetical protein KC466_01185 [Myxococcales bacterium]|nr:hypothetical protein [Myxococcales bacterium]